ncbi:MAG: damage-inducible protein [Stellaceae bacterium]
MNRDPLSALRERVQRIECPTATAHGVVPLGIAAIDRVLPGGGLAYGALHEILGTGGDEEDGALAAAFAAGIVGRTREGCGIVLWCLARPDLYGPGLAVQGLDPARLVLVRGARDADILWAIEEGLRASGVAAVVGEVGALPAVASRRLQLAAERSGVAAFLLRRWRDGGQAARERNLPNAATTRWRIAALPSRPVSTRLDTPIPPLLRRGEGWGGGVAAMVGSGQAPLTLPSSPRGGRGCFTEPGVGHPRWRIELLRCRGGEPACWEVEVREGKATDATDPVSLAAALGDRPAAPDGSGVFRPERIRRTG